MCKSRKGLSFVGVVLLLVLSSWNVFAEPLDINAADAKVIAQVMEGVGKAKAEAIVAYRVKHGNFKHVTELAKVKGIGKKTVEKNRTKLTVGKTR